jgi:hypothetical protein
VDYARDGDCERICQHSSFKGQHGFWACICQRSPVQLVSFHGSLDVVRSCRRNRPNHPNGDGSFCIRDVWWRAFGGEHVLHACRIHDSGAHQRTACPFTPSQPGFSNIGKHSRGRIAGGNHVLGRVSSQREPDPKQKPKP